MLIIVGFLGTVAEGIRRDIKDLRVECSVEMLKKVCLLDTARIFRKVLGS